MTAKSITDTLDSLADTRQAANLARFFKTGPGQYGAGDHFLGLKMPVIRMVAKQYRELNFAELADLLASGIHEYRMTALIILTMQYARAS